jgi:diguanylate cyclase (GGDEF)-like protein
MFDSRLPLAQAARDTASANAGPPCDAQGIAADHRDQLVRYEALFSIIDDLLPLSSLEAVARLVVQRLKYLANASAWRLVMVNREGFTLVEGHRGRATVSRLDTLDPWESFHCAVPRPKVVQRDAGNGAPPLPGVLGQAGSGEVLVTPFVRGDRQCGLLSVMARHAHFTALDQKFLRLFSGQLMNHVDSLLLRLREVESLRSLATTDPLTGALNRGAITEALQSAVAQSRSQGTAVSVVLADADHFKRVNDTHGHPAGDAVLRELARRFTATVRSPDIFGRYGGEEFVFVLCGGDMPQALRIAERLRQCVAAAPIVIDAASGQALAVTISLGVAGNHQDRQASADDLVKQADLALYAAKAAGRDCVRWHAPDHDPTHPGASPTFTRT